MPSFFFRALVVGSTLAGLASGLGARCFFLRTHACSAVPCAAASVITPAAAATKVIVYSASWCGPCHQLEGELHRRKIPFRILDIEKDPKGFEEVQRATGVRAIPLTFVGHDTKGTWIVGFDPDAIEKAFRAKY